ncbi:MAG: hypothetical protein B7733_15275 [Myxococcales bacterium FL481]|nr:MAG: hypothetical protein B7733_15275 [Myxococcales bacterium FL481]
MISRLLARSAVVRGIALAGVGLGVACGSEPASPSADAIPTARPQAQEILPATAPKEADSDEPQDKAADVKRLETLGYISGVVDTETRSGVLLHDDTRAHPGLNFYNSRYDSGAQLIDMTGKVVHRWTGSGAAWQHAELLPTGEVLALEKDKRVVRVDRESNELWSYEALVHHDLSVGDDGRIYVLSRTKTLDRDLHPHGRLRGDEVIVLSPDGKLLSRVDVVAAMQRSPYEALLPLFDRRDGKKQDTWLLDPLHTNHIEVIGPGHPDPRFAADRVLLSMRNIDSVLVLDLVTGEIPWLIGPSFLKYQHHPVLLDSHRILVFDNGRKRSRVVEFDPVTREIHWAYAPKKGFFSRTRGSNQRLANGNTLITESDKGYVLEVTPSGERVWVFANPTFGDEGERSAIWRMTRFDPAALGFLTEAATTP